MPALGGGSPGDSIGINEAAGFEVIDQVVPDLKDGPILYCTVGNPSSNMIAIAAHYAKFNLQQCPSQEGLKLQVDDKTCLSTPLAMLNFVSDKNPALMGKNKAQVMNWIMFSLNETMSGSLNWVLSKKPEQGRNVLKFLDNFLKTRTYLAGERITLADISMSMAVMPMFQHVLDEKTRRSFPNCTRWFNTSINQSDFIKVLGNVKLCGQK